MERSKIRLGLSFCVLTAGIGLGAAAGCSSPGEESEPTATVQQALLPCDPASPFNPPTAAFTGTTLIDGITFSQDGLKAYLSGKIGASNSDIFVATRPSLDDPFGALTKVEGTGPVSTTSSERTPSLSPDGTRLYFGRYVNAGTRFNLYYATLDGSGTPTGVSSMGTSFNGSLNDQDPFFHAGTSKLYFAKEPADGQRDLYVSTFTAPSTYSTPTALSTSSHDEYRPVLSPDGLTLYFSSTQEGIGGDNGGDIWVVKRASTSSAFSFTSGQVTNLYTLNTSRVEFPAGISNDGCTLYFASNRDTTGAQDYRLYQATRGTNVPETITTTIKIVGTGSIITPPYQCSTTCDFEAPPDSVIYVEASDQAIWSGSCSPYGGGESGDGAFVFSNGGTCTVTFPDGVTGAAGSGCLTSTWCDAGLDCTLNVCRCPPGDPNCVCIPSCSNNSCGAPDGCGNFCPCEPGEPCGDDSDCAAGAKCCGEICGGEGCECTATNQCAPDLACEDGACTCAANCEGKTCGDPDGCGGTCPCDQGDPCEADDTCSGDLVCATGTCAPGGCALNPLLFGCGSDETPCDECTRNPICNGDSDCPPGLVCPLDNGWRYLQPGKRICEDPVCAVTPQVLGCGLPTSACGLCPVCVSNCAGKSCGDSSDDGCGFRCTGLCADGDPAGCETNADCGSGSVCLPVDLRCKESVCARTCRPSDPCNTPGLAAPDCGVPGAVCGPGCPTTVTAGGSCRDRECGIDPVYETSCGTCGGGQFCTEAGRCGPLAGDGPIIVPTGLDDPPTREVTPPPSPPAAEVGALAGTFSVTDRGSASYVIPIDVPPGRAGLQPELALRYTSSSGNGAAGLGWSIDGLSAITACNRTYALDARSAVPETYRPNAGDPYCLDGNRLHRLFVNGGVAEYQTSTDTFAQITGVVGSDFVQSEFTVRTKAGRILTYGGASTSALVRRDPSSEEFSTYALSRVADRSGNFMRITYLPVPGRDDQGDTGAELLPLAITYTGHGDDDGDREVLFRYEDRPDFLVGFRPGGLPSQRTQRLDSIEVRARGNLVRRYELKYQHTFGQSRLTSVQESVSAIPCGAAGSLCKPATEFKYNGESGFLPPLEIPAAAGGSVHPFGAIVRWSPEKGWGGLRVPALPDLTAAEERRGDRIVTTTVGGRITYLPSPIPWQVGLSVSAAAQFTPSPYLTAAATIINAINLFGSGEPEVEISYRSYSYSPLFQAPTLELESVSTSIPSTSVIVGPTGGESVRRIFGGSEWFFDADGDGVQDKLYCQPNGFTPQPDLSFKLSEARDVPVGTHPPVPTGATVPQATGSIPVMFPTICRCNVGIGNDCFSTSALPPLIFDVDGDGTANLVISDGNGQWAVLDFSGAALEPVWRTDWVQGLGEFLDLEVHYPIPVDANGDGLRDIVGLSDRIERPSILALNTGRGFDVRVLASDDGQPDALLAPRLPPFVVDLDRDGKEEILDAGDDTDISVARVWHARKITGSVISREAVIGLIARYGTLGDFDGDGNVDLVTPGANNQGMTLHRGLGRVNGLLRQVTDGLGRRVDVEYQDKDASGKLVFDSGVSPSAGFQSACRWPFQCSERIENVVVSAHTDGHYTDQSRSEAALKIDQTSRYSYKGSRADITGGGWLGFWERSVSTFDGAGTSLGKTTIEFKAPPTWDPATSTFPAVYPAAGLTKRVVSVGPVITSPLASSPYSIVSDQSFDWDVQLSARGRPFPVLLGSTTVVASRRSPAPDNVLHRETTSSTTDGYGNVTLHSTTSVDVAAGADVPGSESSVQVTRTFEQPDTSSWLIGQLDTETMVATPRCSGAADCAAKRRTRYTEVDFYPDSVLPKTIRREPGEPNLELTTEISRDPYGNVDGVVRTDSTGKEREVTIGYDSRNLFPTSFTQIGAVTQQTSQVRHDDRFGLPVAFADPNGIDETHSYDEFGIERIYRGPDGQRSVTYVGTNSFTLDDVVQGLPVVAAYRVGITQSDGSSVELDVNPLGQVVRQVTLGFEGVGVATEYVYDGRQRLQIRTRPHLAGDGSQSFVSVGYDDLDRVILESYPNGSSVVHEYALVPDTGVSEWSVPGAMFVSRTTTTASAGASPQVLSVVDVADRDGRTIRRLDGLNQPTDYAYGAFGELTLVTDPAGRAIQLQHDDWSRLESMVDQARGGPESTIYNGFDDAVRVTNAKRERVLDYDDFGRLSTITDGPRITRWTYDGDGSRLNEIGRLTETLSPDGQRTTMRYELPSALYNRGLLTEVTEHIVNPTNLSDARDLTTTYAFNGVTGLLSSVTYPEAFGERPKVNYDYDGFGNLLSVTDGNDPARVHWRMCVADQGYRIHRERTGSASCTSGGSETVTDFNPLDGSVDAITTMRGSTPLQELSYDYDLAGRMIQRSDELRDVTETFGYDALSRLTHVNGAPRYHYDTGGRGRLDFITSNGTTKTYEYQTQGRDWIKRAGDVFYGQDSVGNVTSRTSPTTEHIIEYTEFDLPKRISRNGVVTDFGYDAGGSRAVQTSPTSTTFYAGDHHQEVTQANGVRASRSIVYAAGRAVAQLERNDLGVNATRELFQDVLGSIDVVAPLNGPAEPARQYGPFGERLDTMTSAVPMGFTGHEDDQELGFVNMKGRIYDPQLAQFLQADPIISSAFSQGLNRYAYVDNSPLNFTDPTGFSKGSNSTKGSDCWIDPCRFGGIPSIAPGNSAGAWIADSIFWTYLAGWTAAGLAQVPGVLGSVGSVGAAAGPGVSSGSDSPGGGMGGVTPQDILNSANLGVAIHIALQRPPGPTHIPRRTLVGDVTQRVAGQNAKSLADVGSKSWDPVQEGTVIADPAGAGAARGKPTPGAEQNWKQALDRARWYSSERMAAYTFLDQWNPQSIRNDQEFGTIIVKRGNKFAALGVVPGEQDTLFGLEPYLDSFQQSGPLDTRVTAWAHTHSRWGSNLSGYFGRGDVVFTNENRITGYLGTPQGRFKVLLPGGPVGNVPGVDLGSLPPNSLYAVP